MRLAIMENKIRVIISKAGKIVKTVLALFIS